MENFPRPAHPRPVEDLDRIQAFLCSIPPFQSLPQKEIATVAANLETDTYPPGATLFLQGETVVTHVIVVQSGSLERTIQTNGDVKIKETLGTGRIYGGISILFNNGVSTSLVQCIGETTLYQLDRENFFRLCAKNPSFAGFFKTSLQEEDRRIDRATSTQAGYLDYDHQSSFLSTAVGNVTRACPVCPAATTVRRAAELMTTSRQTAILVADDDTGPKGIVTDFDLRKKVIADGRSVEEPVSAIMSAPLMTVTTDTRIFEAMLTMMRHQVKHLGVTHADGIEGLVTERDLLIARASSPIFLAHGIHTARDIAAVKDSYAKLPLLIEQLIASGAKAHHLTGIITAFTDAALTRIMEMALRAEGPPPVAFAFLVLGSEGRREQTLKTDQDNAIVFEDVPDGELEQVRAYFLSLGTRVCDWLNEIGQTYCENNIMAKNPEWCQPIGKWKRYYGKWIESDDPDRLLNANIFFDFRTGYGNETIAQALHAALFDHLSDYPGFLRHMARSTLQFRPPLGFFGNFVLEERSDRKGGLDIKSAMRLVVDFSRVYAMQERIRETNTIKRLETIHRKGQLDKKDLDDLTHAYEYLMFQRLRHQARLIMHDGKRPDNYLKPAQLTQIEQQSLKEAFKCVRIAQAKMRLDFFLNLP